MRSPRSSATRRAAYTLIELMMVVTIIGVSAMAFAPGIGRATADRRVSSAARELIRIGRRARADTFGNLRAHLLWINPSTGAVQLLRGTTNSCTLNIAGWAAIQADCPAVTTSAPGQRCLENLSLSAMTKDPTIYMYEERLSGVTTSYQNSSGTALCYAPNGIVYWGSGTSLTLAAAALTDTNSSNGGFVFTLHKGGATTSAPIATSRVHRVLFPLGGTARSLR